MHYFTLSVMLEFLFSLIFNGYSYIQFICLILIYKQNEETWLVNVSILVVHIANMIMIFSRKKSHERVTLPELHLSNVDGIGAYRRGVKLVNRSFNICILYS